MDVDKEDDGINNDDVVVINGIVVVAVVNDIVVVVDEDDVVFRVPNTAPNTTATMIAATRAPMMSWILVLLYHGLDNNKKRNVYCTK